jgi:hypothetical protein
MTCASRDDDAVIGPNGTPAVQVDAEVLLARVRELTRGVGLPASANIALSVGTGTAGARDDADSSDPPVEFDSLVMSVLGMLTQHVQDVHALQAATDIWFREEAELSAQEDQRMASRIAHLEGPLEEQGRTIEALLERVANLEHHRRSPHKAWTLLPALRRSGRVLFGAIRGKAHRPGSAARCELQEGRATAEQEHLP